MQAQFGNHPLHAAGADGVAGLADFLGEHAGGSLWIEKPVTNHQLTNLVGPAVGGFGATPVTLQSLRSLFLEELAQLIVALLAEAEFAGGGQRASPLAFAFVEHRQFAGDFIIPWHQQSASGAAKEQTWRIGQEFNHGTQGKSCPGGSLIKYGTKKTSFIAVV